MMAPFYLVPNPRNTHLVVGCAGGGSETSKKEKQGSSPEATASEEARCDGTRTIEKYRQVYTTNDLPGCPKGGLLLGTDGPDKLDGGDGDDEIRGLGATDAISGGAGDDVLYGGDGNDVLDATLDGQRDKLYCGKGKDTYIADKNNDVDSSCEKENPPAAP